MATRVKVPGTVMHEQTYDFAGYGFRLLNNVELLGDLLQDLLSPYVAQISGDLPTYSMLKVPGRDNAFTLHRDEECLLDETRAYPAALIDFLLGDITRQAIGAQTDFLVIHASAASLRGRGIVMPAPPDFGKTTTVAGLVRAGFDYMSDEGAFIHPLTGLLHPFPRPLAMEALSVDAIHGLAADLPDEYHELMPRHQYHVPYELLRAHSRGTPCPIRYVVAPSYSSGSTTELEPMTRAKALILLVEQAFNFRDRPSECLRLLAQVLREAECFRLRIGDLSGAVALIKELFDRGPGSVKGITA